MFYTNTCMFISANVTKEYNPNFLNVTSLYIRNKIEKEIFIPEKTSPRGTYRLCDLFLFPFPFLFCKTSFLFSRIPSSVAFIHRFYFFYPSVSLILIIHKEKTARQPRGLLFRGKNGIARRTIPFKYTYNNQTPYLVVFTLMPGPIVEAITQLFIY